MQKWVGELQYLDSAKHVAANAGWQTVGKVTGFSDPVLQPYTVFKESSLGLWIPGSKMTGGGAFLGFQPPSAGARSPSLLGEKTKCESVPCVGE